MLRRMSQVGEGGGDAAAAEVARDPVEILPDEMWRAIFKFVKEDPRDILNLAGTCVQFETLLQDDHDIVACELEEVAPLLLKWLRMEDIFNLRGICMRVRKTVDKVLDHLELINPHEGLNLFPRLAPPHSSSQSFELRHFSSITKCQAGLINSVEGIEAARRMIEDRLISRVPSKTLTLAFHWSDDDHLDLDPPDFLDRSLALLGMGMIRDQVWHLSLLGNGHDEGINADPIRTYDLIRKCVGALPNLKTLLCYGLFALAQVDPATVELYIANGHPLPPAPLQQFNTDTNDPLPVPLFREIARRYGDTLKQLELYLRDEEIEGLRWEEDYHFPALLSLELRGVNLRWRHMLSRLHAAQLKQLIWKETSRRPAPVSPVTLFIRALQQFPTLEHLDLNALIDMERPSDALRQLRHERHYGLKQLEMRGCCVLLPLQYFSRLFPNLESVHLDLLPPFVIERFSAVDSELGLCHRREMEESVLWYMLPKMKAFRYGDYHCSRAEAEMFQNRRD